MNDLTAGIPASSDIAKAQAKRLRSALMPEVTIGHSQSLELIAKVHGEQSWGRLNSLLPAAAAVLPVANPTQKAEQEKLPDNHLEQRGLQALLRGLRAARETKPTAKTTSFMADIHKEEIISSWAFETYLDTLDVGLGGMIFDLGVEQLINLSGIEATSRFARPKSREREAYATSGLRPLSFAAGLIWLERLGFDTHPEIVYEPYLETLRKSRYLNPDELTCFWHQREKKGRFQTNEHWIDAKTAIPKTREETFEGRSGLKIHLIRNIGELELIHSLRVYR